MYARRVLKSLRTKSAQRLAEPEATASRKSYPISIRPLKDGLSTSNMRTITPLVPLTALYADVSGLYCESKKNGQVLVKLSVITGNGQMLSSLNGGFSPCIRPTFWRANPGEETTDWRAVCGRTACTVRRAGRVFTLSDPYQVCGICNFGRLKFLQIPIWDICNLAPLAIS